MSVNVKDEINRYISSNETVGAMMVTGNWGSGKSYLVKQIADEQNKSEEKEYAMVVVSLFGIDSIDTLTKMVNKSVCSVIALSKNDDKTKERTGKLFGVLKTLTNELKEDSKVIDGIDKIINLNPFDFIELSDTVTFLGETSPRRLVLIFDDFERCDCPITSLLGVINEYTENKGIKTIIVSDEKKIEDLFAELESLAIPSDDLTTVCMEIVRRIEEHPDDEQLQRLYCQLITDVGLFYSLWERDMEQIIRNYYRQKEQAERLVQEIQKAIAVKDRLQILRQETRKRLSTASEYPEEEEMIHRLSLQYSFLYKGRKNTAYAENIRILVRMVNSKPVLRQVKPYLIATVLSRKHSMILTHPDYVPNLENVLKFKLYNIHKDNGKNFDTYQSYVELYEHLRRFYQSDGTVDMDFSDFCFASLSNLSEWYYLYCEPNEAIPMNLMRKVKTLKAPMFPMLSEDGEQGDLEMELEDRLIYAASIWMPEQIEE